KASRTTPNASPFSAITRASAMSTKRRRASRPPLQLPLEQNQIEALRVTQGRSKTDRHADQRRVACEYLHSPKREFADCWHLKAGRTSPKPAVCVASDLRDTCTLRDLTINKRREDDDENQLHTILRRQHFAFGRDHALRRIRTR